MAVQGLRWMQGAAILIVAGISTAQVDKLAGESATTIQTADSVAAANQPNEAQFKTESKPIPFKSTFELSRTVGAGRVVKVQPGKNGAYVTKYKLRYENGKLVGKDKVETVRIEPVNEKFLVGKEGYSVSRGAYTRGKTLVMNASAYDPSAGRGSRATFRTKTGERARYGVVAVDPRVIPLGTMVYVEGYGLAKACDIGGAIKGNRIDLCMATRAECMRFGRRKVVVHILK